LNLPEIPKNTNFLKTFLQMVKKIQASIMQCIDIAMFTGGHAKARVASLETTEGCPIAPGSSLQKVRTLFHFNLSKPVETK
jgi:hypothetical protein